MAVLNIFYDVFDVHRNPVLHYRTYMVYIVYVLFRHKIWMACHRYLAPPDVSVAKLVLMLQIVTSSFSVCKTYISISWLKLPKIIEIAMRIYLSYHLSSSPLFLKGIRDEMTFAENWSNNSWKGYIKNVLSQQLVTNPWQSQWLWNCSWENT